jgi:hypothetical protein
VASTINKEFGRRPYVSSRKGSKDSYVEEMRKITEKADADRAAEIGYRIPQSEFKRPYASPTYQGMEHYKNPENPPFKPPPEEPPVDPFQPVVPPPEPGPGPGPGPGPTPGPTPTPVPPGGNCNGCWGPPGFQMFCRNGAPITIVPALVCGSDPIVAVTVASAPGTNPGSASGGGGSSGIFYTPGNASGATVTFHTKSGLTCSAQVLAKPDSDCPQPEVNCSGITINYTTTQMGIGETQSLSYTPVSGCDCTWSVSGGGTIDGNGLYTAPASNSNCVSTPVVTLACNGSVMDTLSLAISNMTNACSVAAIKYSYRDYTYNPMFAPEGTGFCCSVYYNCMGAAMNPVACSLDSSVYCTQLYPGVAVRADNPVPATPEGVCSSFNPAVDMRTSGMILAGCCPVQLM